MKKVFMILFIICILLVSGFGIYYYQNMYQQNNDGRKSSSSENAVLVEKVSDITGNNVKIRYGGETVAQNMLEIPLDSDKTVKECYVEEGQIVKKNDPLFTYDTKDDEDKIAQDKIDIDKNKVNIESAKAEITEQEKLQNNAEDELDREEARIAILTCNNEIKSSEYEIKQKEKEIEELNESIENSVVTAENGGIVQNISNPNANDDYDYSEAEKAYITILAEGDFRIQASINEEGYENINEGMTVLVFSRTDSDRYWRGVISEISDEADKGDEDEYDYYGTSNSSSYTFYVEIEDENDLILGEHVYIEIDEGQKDKKGIWLSDEYIIEENGKTYVWFASDSNKLEKHEIVCGEYDEELKEHEVLDGLKLYDYIAYSSDDMKEGLPVRYNNLVADSKVDDDGYVTAEDYDEENDEYYDEYDDGYLDDYEIIGGDDDDWSEDDWDGTVIYDGEWN